MSETPLSKGMSVHWHEEIIEFRNGEFDLTFLSCRTPNELATHALCRICHTQRWLNTNDVFWVDPQTEQIGHENELLDSD